MSSKGAAQTQWSLADLTTTIAIVIAEVPDRPASLKRGDGHRRNPSEDRKFELEKKALPTKPDTPASLSRGGGRRQQYAIYIPLPGNNIGDGHRRQSRVIYNPAPLNAAANDVAVVTAQRQ